MRMTSLGAPAQTLLRCGCMPSARPSWYRGTSLIIKKAFPQDPTVGICLGTYDGPRGKGVFLRERYPYRVRMTVLGAPAQTLLRWEKKKESRGAAYQVARELIRSLSRLWVPQEGYMGYLAHKKTPPTRTLKQA